MCTYNEYTYIRIFLYKSRPKKTLSSISTARRLPWYFSVCTFLAKELVRVCICARLCVHAQVCREAFILSWCILLCCSVWKCAASVVPHASCHEAFICVPHDAFTCMTWLTCPYFVSMKDFCRRSSVVVICVALCYHIEGMYYAWFTHVFARACIYEASMCM